MAKVGITQGNPLAALGNILRKGGPGRGSGRDSRSPRRESPITKKASLRGSKESLTESTKDSTDSPGRTGEQKSPKMFRFGIRRSSSRSKKGDRDDSASDTSSVNSLNVVPVKEEPMETESSGLTVSHSATERETKEEEAGKSASASTSTKATNRNSTYFKPPEVEPLADLFASGELDALLKPNSAEEKEAPEKEEEEEKEREEPEKSDVEEPPSNGSGLKRNNLRSSFRMYESRYKAETLEKKKESPLSASVSAAKPSESTEPPSDTATADPPSQLATASDGVDSFLESPPAKSESEDAGNDEESKKRERDRERRRRKLFDDELFQSDLPTRTSARAKAPATATPSLDAYAKAHQSPSPKSETQEHDRSVTSIEEASEPTIQSSIVENKGVSHSEEPAQISAAANVGSEQPETEMSPEEGESSQSPTVDVSDGGSAEGNEKKMTVEAKSPIHEPSQTVEKSSTVFDKTRLEQESEERESKKDSPSPEKPQEVADKKPDQEEVADDKKKGEGKVSSDGKSRAAEKGLGEASTSRRRREEKPQQKSPRSARSHDARSRIESGKVSSARSKFDSTSASPKVSRARASTELPSERRTPRSSEERDGKSLSWMSDLQKRREQRAKAKEQTTRAKPSTGGGDEDLPDWRKRVLERRKKAAEAHTKPSSTEGAADRSSGSPRSGRYREAKTEKSPRRGDVRKSPSPSTSKKTSTRAIKSPAKDTLGGSGSTIDTKAKEDTDFKEDEPEHTKTDKVDGGGDDSGELSETKQKSEALPSLSNVDTSTSEEVTSSKPEVTSPKPEITSPKPEITSPKPKIEIATRKVSKRSSSSEPVEKPTLSIDVKPPAGAEELDESAQEKSAADDEVFASETNKETTSPRNTSQSPSNLPEQVPAESREATRSRRSSSSSEKEVGVPFRSRGISHSRSPTPTSVTPGPLKLPAEPGVPEWKKKVLERKKDPAATRKPQSASKSEPDVPAWKKELLAKKAKLGNEVRNFEFGNVLHLTSVFVAVVRVWHT